MVNAINAIASVVAATPGIQSHSRGVPMAVQTPALPSAHVTPVSETRRQHAQGMQRAETVVRIRVVHSPVARGLTVSQQQALYTLADAVMQQIMNDITLGGQVDHVSDVASDEPGIFTLAGTDYLSVNILARVVDKF